MLIIGYEMSTRKDEISKRKWGHRGEKELFIMIHLKLIDALL